MRQVASVVLTLLLVGHLTMAQSSASGTRKATAKSSQSQVSAQLTQMQKALESQQQQIQQLMQQLQSRDGQIQQLQQQMTQVQSSATEAQQKADAAAAQNNQQDVAALKSSVADLQTNTTNTALSLQDTQKRIGEMESPLAIHFKGITITPGGFLAAETVWRNRALAADVNTPFTSIPFSGNNQGHLSEFYGSGRQSRIALLAEGKLSNTKLTGYYESDFLSAAVTSNNNQSNSYSLRQRQLWGQAALHGWSFTAGQMWSLVTETKKGVDNRSEALPMTIDAQYTVGFSWARQYGVRVAKNFHDKMWLAVSLENPQTTLTTHGNSPNFVVGSLGNSGGLYNAFNGNYSFNVAPDLIGKAVFEPGFGHYEIFGILAEFRDRVFPCGATAAGASCQGTNVTGPSAFGAFNSTKVGGGLGANARWSFVQKKVDFGLHFLGGNGVGRYGTAGLSDVTARPDGQLGMIRSYQGLGTLELHTAKLDVYGNGGAEYAGRHFGINNLVVPAVPVGYGAPGFVNSGCSTEQVPGGANGFTPAANPLPKCTGDTRVIIEGTFGFWYRLYNGPKGRVQWGPQYSYVVRNTWAGTPGQPAGNENMVLTSFRYYLP